MDKLFEQKEINRLIERNQNEFKELNSALISSASIWAVKAGEHSLIEIADIMTAKGVLKKEWIIRKEIAFNHYERIMYTEHESLIQYLENYLQWRIEKKHGVTNVGEYRCLDPESKLFLDKNGIYFKFSKREKENTVNLQPTGLNRYMRDLILNAGLAGYTYKDFRRSLAIQTYRDSRRKSGVIKDIMEYLGVRSYSTMRNILKGDPRLLHEMIKGIHKKI